MFEESLFMALSWPTHEETGSICWQFIRLALHRDT